MTKARRLSILVALCAGGLALMALTLTASAEPAARPSDTFTYPGPDPCDTTLQACLDAANPGDEIFISADTYITSLVLSKAVSLTGADLSTTILQAPPGQRVLLITGTAVTPDTRVSNLTIHGGTLASGNGAAILVENGAQPTLENLIIQGGLVTAAFAAGGGLFTESSLTLTNILFFENAAFDGYGGGLGGGPGAHLVLNNVTFDSNGANRNGGGLYADSATINGSTFVVNVTGVPGYGGGAYITGTVDITDTLFIENQAHEAGGGLFTLSNATISGGAFRSNVTQDENGGALEAGGDLLLDGTVVTGSLSLDSGGALFVTGTTTIKNALIAENRSTAGAGGGLRAVGEVHISDSQFISNSSFNQGGGLRVNAAIFLTNTLFMSNTSGVGGGTAEGGGLRANAAATINGGSFVANSARKGGGAYVQGTLALSDTTFSDNTAQDFGGGLYMFVGTVQNATFAHNQVISGNGGGLAAITALTVTGSNFSQNAALTGTQSAATGTGGGLFGDGVVNSSGNRFFDNFAHRLGGGMDADDLQSTGDQFRGNLSGPQSSGAGLFVSGVFELESAQFFTNTANTGGGLGVNSSASGAIFNSLFARNVVTFTDGGAAIRLLASTSVMLTHNTFVGTSASSRSAIHMQSPTGDFSFFANIFSQFAIVMKQFGSAPTSTVSLDHNVYYSITSFLFVGPVSPGASDITGTVIYRDPAADDYHLMPGSVAIDHAPSYGLSTDFEGQQRPIGLNYDAGFDEASIVTLGISKTDGLDAVLAGDPLTYTIVVSNAGPHDAIGVRVSDDPPAGLTGVTWTCAPGVNSTCPAAGAGAIDAEVTVASGSSITFTVLATVDVNASGTLINTAALSVPENTVNTNAANESATDSTTVVPLPPPPLNKLYLPVVLS